jgi:hypothetical protein
VLQTSLQLWLVAVVEDKLLKLLRNSQLAMMVQADRSSQPALLQHQVLLSDTQSEQRAQAVQAVQAVLVALQLLQEQLLHLAAMAVLTSEPVLLVSRAQLHLIKAQAE